MVPAPNDTKSRMVLLEFDCNGNSLLKFEDAAYALNRLQNMSIQMPRHWVYGNHSEHRYILVDVDPQDFLSLREFAKNSLRDRLDILCRLLGQAAELQEQGILLREPSWSKIQFSKGEYRFWDHTGALLRRDVTETAWTNACRIANAAMVKLVYQGILGRDLPTIDLKPNLTILLCHVVDSEALSAFCDAMEDCLFQTEDSELGKLLETLCILRKFGPEPRQKNAWEPWQIVAEFLYRTPLYPYVRKNDCSDSLLKVVLFGRSDLRKEFFSQIISAAQILDNRLHLHIIAPDAAEFWSECCAQAPLLERVVRVNGNDSTLEHNLTGHNARGEVMPLAELTLEATDQLSPKVLCQDGIGCLLLLEPYGDTVSFQLCDLVNRTEDPLLVGVCQERPMAYDTIGRNCMTTLRSIHRGTGRFEDTEIYQKALGVHSYYEKHYDQRISPEKILEHFSSEQGDHYNLRSSIRSALSIPYKLRSDAPDLTWFHREILEKNDKLLYRLIWLEHRSWQAHLILDGWRLNPDDFGNSFDIKPFRQKDDREKWHICLRGSDDTGRLPLDDWDWENGDLLTLDPLDRMSVEIHRSLERKASSHQTELDNCLTRHQDKLKPAQYQQVANSVTQLRKNVTNAALGWNRTCKELGWDKSCSELDPDTNELLSLVQELVDRNARRDYKKIDLSIIKAIPYLERQKPIRHIYSLCAGHPWHNVAVTMLLEPETLTLLTDDQQSISPETLVYCATFLRNRRNLKTEVSTLALAELEQLLSDAVLDVTGADADQILAVMGSELLRDLPMVAYRNGSLTCLRGKQDDLCFYPRYHSITVEEMLSLTGTTVLNEYSEIPMHGMSNYKNLWETVQMCSAYNKMCDYLESLRQDVSIPGKIKSWDSDMPENIAKNYGFSDLLSKMASKGLIQKHSDHNRVYPSDALLIEIPKEKKKDKKQDKPPLMNALDQAAQIIRNTDQKCVFSVDDKNTGNWKIECDQKALNVVIPFIKPQAWCIPCTEEDAQKNGLASLLNALGSKDILKNYTVQLGAYVDAKCTWQQGSLNRLLDTYMRAVKDNRKSDLHLNISPDNPDDVVVLEDRRLSVKIENAVPKGITAAALKECLQRFADNALITNLTNIAQAKPPYTFSFDYKDYATKDCLTKVGNALEALTYHTLRNMNVFDDVKLGVSFQWAGHDDAQADTRNEIDVICTKGMKSYFISCKQTYTIDKLQLNEILYEAERFGIDAVPILVTSAQKRFSQTTLARAKRMGVHIITLTKELSHKDQTIDSAKELEDQFRDILEKD